MANRRSSRARMMEDRDDPPSLLRRVSLRRQNGCINVWKAPIALQASPVRYARRGTRSPSPIPNRKVSFRMSLKALPDLEHFESIVTECSDVDDSTRSSSSTGGQKPDASVKTSLKVKTLSESLSRGYDISFAENSRRVEFGNVSVSFHSIILGCNPAVSSGPPVTIDWKPMDSVQMPMDEYESTKGPSRSMNELKMGRVKRETLLKFQGFGRADMDLVTRQVEKIRLSRARNAGVVSNDSHSRKAPQSSGRVGGGKVPKFLQFLVAKPKA